MDINLTVDSNDFVRIFINENLASEICVQRLTSLVDLQDEVTSARRLEALPKIFRSHLKHLIDGRNMWDEGMRG